MSVVERPRLDAEASRALIAVPALTRARGEPPTWAELGTVMHWPAGEVDQRIRALFPLGLRWRSGIPRSLNVLPHALREALAAVKEQREARP
jgi:hypothetical protein